MQFPPMDLVSLAPRNYSQIICACLSGEFIIERTGATLFVEPGGAAPILAYSRKIRPRHACGFW
jgi:hypothetical protein